MVMCFKDMTFCRYGNCAKFKDCHKALTEEVRAAADHWWNDCEGEAPICSYAEQPDCFKEAQADG